MPERLWLITESSTDVRLVDGLAEFYELTVLARTPKGGVAVSGAPAGAPRLCREDRGRVSFAAGVLWKLATERASVDLVLVQGYGATALAANVAARLTGTPTAMLVCSPLEEYYRCRRLAPAEGRRFRRWELAFVGVFARLNATVGRWYVVLSKHLADTVLAVAPNRRVDICPVYGVDCSTFRPSRLPRAALRSQLGLPDAGALLFFSSRIAPEKDVDTLLRAVQRLLADGRDLYLLNTSGGYREIRERARSLGLDDRRLIALPPVDPRTELVGYYQAADVCVQASLAEGLGFSPLEALASGTPVVAADVGGLRETVIDGSTGWTYRPGDSNGLASAIAAALDDPREAASRAALGRELVLETYERQRVFERLRTLLDDSADRRRVDAPEPAPDAA